MCILVLSDMTCPVPSQSTELSVENPNDSGCGNRSNPRVSISACILDHLPRSIIFCHITATSTPVTSTLLSDKVSGSCQTAHRVGYLTAFHSELVDSLGCVVHLSGVNWFGFETSTFAPHGLWARNWKDMLKQIAQTGFNTIRLPFTDQLLDPGIKTNGINYQLNPDLKGLSGLALMDRIIQGAGQIGLKIILDRHDPTADLPPPIRFTGQNPRVPWSN